MTRLCSILTVFCLAALHVAHAQTPPSPSQIAAYSGLNRAAHDNDVSAIKTLVAGGSDLEQRDKSGRTAVHIAAFASSDEALIALAEAGADMNALENRDYDVVTIAAVANDPEMVSLAIRLGNSAGLITSPYEGTALIAAAHLGHHEVVRRLIDGGAPLDHVNNLGWTALMEAIVLGDGGPDYVATVEVLLGAGADPAITDKRGASPLHHATARRYVEIADLLWSATH